MKFKEITRIENQGGRLTYDDALMVLEEKGIFALSDGFGGGHEGREASLAACDSVEKFLIKEAGDDEATFPFVMKTYYSLSSNVLFNSMIIANRAVLKRNKGKGIHQRGGCSLIAGYLDGDLLSLANVGATSAWLIRGGKVSPLISPRSYARLCDPLFSEDFAMFPNAPLMSLGTHDDLDPEIFEFKMRPDDIVFCLSGKPSEGLILAINEAIAAGNLIQSSDEIESLKSGLSTDDNTTLLLIKFES